MTGKWRRAVVPAYLLLCLLLGGSAQGIWQNLVLQLLALALIAWSMVASSPYRVPPPGRTLLVLAGLTISLFAIHLLPLPPSVWTLLPGRSVVVDGYRLLGVDLPWLPLSIEPYATMAAAAVILPPFAIIVAMFRLRAFDEQWLAIALIAGAVASVLLGVMQAASGGQSYYLYRYSNVGVATGFFANSNHFASLLLISIPFLAALVGTNLATAGGPARRPMVLATAAAVLALFGLGIVLNRSLAVLLLGPLVLAASASLIVQTKARRLWMLLAIVGIGLVVTAIVLPRFPDAGADSGTMSVALRVDYWSTSLRAAMDYFPFGSGFGTFPAIYPLWEDPSLVDRWHVNHAHNDYVEWFLETGVLGAGLVMVFLVWWARRAAHAWTSADASPAMKAATIASAAILAHSIVDYPLRTAALSAAMAVCLALLAFPRRIDEVATKGDLRPTRHLSL